MESQPPEPCRDQQTISSFKRTFNAAILTLVASRNATGPVRKYTVLVVAVLLGWRFRSDIGAFLS